MKPLNRQPCDWIEHPVFIASMYVIVIALLAARVTGLVQ